MYTTVNLRKWRWVLLVVALGALTLFQAGLMRVGRAVVGFMGPHRVPIQRVETPEKMVALTLEGVWVDTQTGRILDVLKESGVRATFFLTGYWTERYPQLARRIAGEGHEIGNLTYSYPHLTSLEPEEIRHELEKNQQVIRETTITDPQFCRPPFGEVNQNVMEVAENLGYLVITGDVDIQDHQHPNPDVVLEKALRQVKPGSILMLRLTGRNTLTLLTRLLPLLMESGYRVVPLGEMIWEENYYVTPEGVQRLLPGITIPTGQEIWKTTAEKSIPCFK